VIQVDDVVETANENMLQTATIADKSGTAKVVLWGDDVNTLSTMKCYKFEKVCVKEFRGQTQLSFSNSKVHEIDYIDTVDPTEETQTHTIHELKVIGVQFFEVDKACLKCRSKLPHGCEEEYDTCMRCGMLQCTNACNMEATAQVMVKSSSNA